MPDQTRTPDLEAVTRMVADKIALAHAMFDGTGRAPFIEFGFSEAEDIRAALERAERVEAAARVLDGAWGRWNANLAVIGGGADNMDRFVALETAFTELRAGLAPVPGEEGKGG